MSPLVANLAAISENPAAGEQLAMVGEKCLAQSAQTAVLPPRYPLNQKTTDQYTAVIVTKPEGNPQARLPHCNYELVRTLEIPGFFHLLMSFHIHINLPDLFKKCNFDVRFINCFLNLYEY